MRKRKTPRYEVEDRTGSGNEAEENTRGRDEVEDTTRSTGEVEDNTSSTNEVDKTRQCLYMSWRKTQGLEISG